MIPYLMNSDDIFLDAIIQNLWRKDGRKNQIWEDYRRLTTLTKKREIPFVEYRQYLQELENCIGDDYGQHYSIQSMLYIMAIYQQKPTFHFYNRHHREIAIHNIDLMDNMHITRQYHVEHILQLIVSDAVLGTTNLLNSIKRCLSALTDGQPFSFFITHNITITPHVLELLLDEDQSTESSKHIVRLILGIDIPSSDEKHALLLYPIIGFSAFTSPDITHEEILLLNL